MPADRVIDAIRTLARDPDPRSDGELVRRFVAARDEDAFAELLRRHGPTVFGVCRRVLGRSHDAEDAFQAVWVVFARRAGDIHPPGSVGHFLYGVAVRTATKARIMAAKRKLRELASQEREPASQERERLENAELAAILDDELAKLPDKYRAAVVLCDLNGKSRSQAAAELGWPEGTVADRVRKGRELLATRLRARGVTLSLAALAGAAVPAQLTASVLASTFGGAVSSSALILAEGVMRTMSVAKWKLPVVLLAVCGLTVGIGFANKPAPVDPPVPPVVVKVPDEPKPVAPVPQGGGMWKEATAIDTTGWLPGSVAYAPDGKMMVVGGTGGHVRAYDASSRKQAWEYKDGEHFASVAYSRGITGRDDDGAEVGATFKDGVRLLDPKTGMVIRTLTETGSAPLAVGFFRDKIHLEGGDRFTYRKVVFGNSQGSVVKTWLNNGEPGTIKTVTKHTDTYAVPLAIEPRMVIGPLAVMTGPLDRNAGGRALKHVLWAYACGGGGKNTLLEGHKATVVCGAWSSDGKTIVTGDAVGTVILWDGDTFKEKARVRFDQRVVAVAVNADGSCVAAAVVVSPQLEGEGQPTYQERVHVWDAANPPKTPPALPMAEEEFGGPFLGLGSLAFSPDGKSLSAAFANFDHLTKLGELRGKVRTWTLASDKKPAQEKPAEQKWQQVKVLSDHNAAVGAVAFAPNGREFASIGGDGFVRTWDAATLKVLAKHAMPDRGPAHLTYAPDGKAFVVASPGGVQVYDAATGKPGIGRKVKSVLAAFSPDGKWLAHTDGLEVQVIHADGNLGIVAEQTGDPKSGGPWFAAMAWAPDSKRMALAMNDKAHSVLAWNVQNDEPSKRLVGHAEPVLVVAWSKDGKTIATGDVIGRVILWDATTGKELRRVQLGGRNGKGMVCALAFDPDSRSLAVGMLHEDGKGVERVVFLDVASGEHIGFVQTHEIGVPFSVAYSPDGKRIIVGGRPSTNGASTNAGIGVWDAEEAPKPAPAPQAGGVGREMAAVELTGWLAGSVAYSPDGKAFAVGGTGGNVTAFDAATRTKLWAAKLDAKSSAVAYTRDGKHVAATFKDGVRFLDAATGQEGEAIIEKDSHPTVVATFPDEPDEADPKERRHKIAFDGEGGTHLKHWVKWSKVEGICRVAGGDPAVRRPLGGVALAADPRGQFALVTGIIRDKSDKYELGGVHVIRKPDATGFDQRPMPSFATQNASVYCAAWSEDGKTIVAGDEYGNVILWDFESKDRKSSVSFDRRVVAVAINADGSRVAAAVIANDQREGEGQPSYRERVYVWDTKNPPKNPAALSVADDAALGGPFRGLGSLAFSPDGKSLTAAFANLDHFAKSGELRGKVRTWTLPDTLPARAAPDAPRSANWKERQVPEFVGTAEALAFAPDGKTFASYGKFGRANVWDSATLKHLVVFGNPCYPCAGIAYSPDSQTLAFVRSDGIGLHPVGTGKFEGLIDIESNTIRSLTFSRDGKEVLFTDGKLMGRSALPGMTPGARILKVGKFSDNVSDEKPIPYATIALSHPDAAPHTAFIENQRRDKSVIAVHADDKTHTLDGHKELVTSFAWSKDGRTLVSVGDDGQVVVWDGATYKERRRFAIGDRKAYALALAPDGKTVAVTEVIARGPGVSHVWVADVETGKVVDRLVAGYRERNQVAFSPDGKTLVVSSSNLDVLSKEQSTIRVYERLPAK